MKNARLVTAPLTIGLIMLVAAGTSATQGVSPGATDRLAQVNNACPTFSWGLDGDAITYDLISYLLPEDASQQGELTSDTEVLFTRVSGSATSWTPSTNQCFAPGGRYVWFVRAVTELADDQVIEAGEWSEGRYFIVPAGPTEDEVARAIEVLKRWEVANGGGSMTLAAAAATVSATDTATATVSDADTVTATGSAAPKSVPFATAAIRGYQSDGSGETYGVVGMSGSPDGGGIGAANLVGGPDLVLDGIAQGQTDARLSQAGIDRPSAANEEFRFWNSGPGFMDVLVDGEVSASQIKGDELWAASGLVVDDEGNWQGAGETIPCMGCVGPDDIADGQVDITKLSGQGGESGEVLKFNGTSVVWSDDLNGNLTLPFQGSADTDDPVFSVSKSGDGTGVAIYGESNNSHGVFGWTNASQGGSGVYGEIRRATGMTGGAGVQGLTRTPQGIGVYGIADPFESLDGTGVAGRSEYGVGVSGRAERGIAVRGEVNYGRAIVGVSNGSDTGATSTGVYGEIPSGSSGFGVHGVVLSVAGRAVFGELGSNWGTLGLADAGVEGIAEAGHGVEARSTGDGYANSAIYAESDGSDSIAILAYNNSSTNATIIGSNDGTGNSLELKNGGDLRLRVNAIGDVTIDGGFFTGGADFAELLPAYSDDLEPGDVLAIAADGRLAKSQRAYQASVVGVYSTKPGILGGYGIDGDAAGKVPLAIIGVVPVKTCDENGPVRPGDMLVSSSIPGHAMRAGDRAPNGRVIGKALSGLEEGEGEITMLVILQ